MDKKKKSTVQVKKKIHQYRRRKHRFDDLLTPKEKQRALSLWYKEKYKNANGEIRK